MPSPRRIKFQGTGHVPRHFGWWGCTRPHDLPCDGHPRMTPEQEASLQACCVDLQQAFSKAKPVRPAEALPSVYREDFVLKLVATHPANLQADQVGHLFIHPNTITCAEKMYRYFLPGLVDWMLWEPTGSVAWADLFALACCLEACRWRTWTAREQQAIEQLAQMMLATTQAWLPDDRESFHPAVESHEEAVRFARFIQTGEKGV